MVVSFTINLLREGGTKIRSSTPPPPLSRLQWLPIKHTQISITKIDFPPIYFILRAEKGKVDRALKQSDRVKAAWGPGSYGGKSRLSFVQEGKIARPIWPFPSVLSPVLCYFM